MYRLRKAAASMRRAVRHRSLPTCGPVPNGTDNADPR